MIARQFVCLLFQRVSIRSPKVIFICLMLLIFGLLATLMCRIRDVTNPAMNLSAPDTLRGVIYHVGPTEHRGKAMLTTFYESPGKEIESIIGLFTFNTARLHQFSRHRLLGAVVAQAESDSDRRCGVWRSP